jgi:hypothetical protein
MQGRSSIAFIVIAAVLVSTPRESEAQFPSIPATRESPRIWAGAGAGIADFQSLIDASTGASWDFGTMFQGRATIERALQGSSSLGLVGTYGRGPMTYRGSSCAVCAADVTVWQLLAMFRIGGGSGLHQVIEVGGGLTGFSNVAGRNTAQELEAASFTDGTISIGYGFGYPITPTTAFSLVQELGILFHNSGSSAGASSSNTIRTSVTRVGLRFVVGGGAPTR